MMKHINKQFIFLNEALHFYNPLLSNFRCFVNLFLTFIDKSQNEKVYFPFQSFKNQHLEKMLVFFCIKISPLFKCNSKYSFERFILNCTFELQQSAISLKIN